jgi:hypothetical protein
VGLSACVNPQQTQRSNITIDANGYAHVTPPPGLEGYAERRAYQSNTAQAKVAYARKMLTIDQQSYNEHPDAEHATRLEESRERLRAAVREQEAQY